MNDRSTPDDIKIIAQFLADRAGPEAGWAAHTRDAFKLRQQLKLRGGYRLTKAQQG